MYIDISLVARILRNAEILTMQTSRNRLTVMATADVVVLGTQMVVYLGEISLLVSGIGITERGLPVVGEVLVVLHLLDA